MALTIVPDPTSPGKLMDLLVLFEQTMLSSVTSIRATMLLAYYTLLMAQIVWFGIQVLRGRPIGGMLLELLVRSSVVLVLLYEYPTLLSGVQKWATHLGLSGAGDTLTVAQLLDPSAVMGLGFRASANLFELYAQSSGLTSIPTAFAWFGAWTVYLGAFAYLAIQLFIWQAEALFASAWAMVMVPWLAYRGTAWIGQGVLAYLVNLGTKFGMAALATSVVFRSIELITAPPNVSLHGAIVYILLSLVFAVLFWRINALAAWLSQGQSGLGAGSVFAAAGAALGSLGAVLFGGAAAGVGIATLASGSGHGVLMAARQVAGTHAALRQGASLPTALRHASAYTQTAQPAARGLTTRLAGTTTRLAHRSLQQSVNWSRLAHSDRGHGGVRS